MLLYRLIRPLLLILLLFPFVLVACAESDGQPPVEGTRGTGPELAGDNESAATSAAVNVIQNTVTPAAANEIEGTPPTPAVSNEIGSEESSGADDGSAGSAQEVFLLPFKVECEDEGQLALCIVAIIGDASNFQPFAGDIDGFDYEWGYAYSLDVTGEPGAMELVQVTEKMAEPGGVSFEMTLTGGDSRLVEVGDDLYEFYGEKRFACAETASCQSLRQIVDNPEAINFKFKTPADPADPLLMLSWASASPALQAEQGSRLENTTWVLGAFIADGVEQRPVLEGTAVTAEFSLDEALAGGTMAGSSGCNNYTAAVNIVGNTINIDPFEIGQAQCDTPPQVMNQELEFLDALILAESFLVEGDRLQLSYSLGQNALTFSAAP